jgi:predicted HAD superfamily Cof-like phosphohydrolase
MSDMVMEFHQVYNTYISEKPELRDKKIAKLRIGLFDEELNEFKEAVYTDNLVEIADAIGDIIYIAIGAAISYGIPIDEVFTEIHRSNMSKLDAHGHPIHREDGKVVKGPNYVPPDIAPILRKYGGAI